MRLLVLFIIGLLLINMGLHGRVGSYLAAIITPDAMVEN